MDQRDPKVRRFGLQAAARRLLPGERVAGCLRQVRPGVEAVEIWYSPRHGRASLGGLLVCGSVWNCPVCAAKVTERRRVELQSALAQKRYSTLLLTYTLRHQAGDALRDLTSLLLKALRAMQSGVGWQRQRKRFGWVGSVRALEVTYGVHGWHPHIHQLVFLEGALNQSAVDGLETYLKDRWGMVLARCGLDASWRHGLDVRSASKDIAAYVSKYGREPRRKRFWTDAHEVTKQPVKRGRLGGRTPSQLLEDYLVCGDGAAARLFVEYAGAFKHKKQLVWSKGLREQLGLEAEWDDLTVATRLEEDGELLLRLSGAVWRRVVGSDARGELLAVAGGGDGEAVAKFLASLG